MAFYNYTLHFLLLLFSLFCPSSHVLARHLNNIQPITGRHLISSRSIHVRHLISSRSIPGRHLSSVVPAAPPFLTYHNGTLLTGNSRSTLLVHLLWYGSFTPSQRSIVTDFLNSFDQPSGSRHAAPSVWTWWQIARSYVDKNNASVASVVKLGEQFSDVGYSMGKSLKRVHTETLLLKAIKAKSLPSLPTAERRFSNTSSITPSPLYLVLTAADVYIERFCMDSCGFHDYTMSPYHISTGDGKTNPQLPFAWVGNAVTQCPGLCAWPFAISTFGPPNPPLIPPNRDVGMDGMIINIATLLAGAATNPFGTGYFQGEALAPLEAATACVGSFGLGSYPSYPGELPMDNNTKASFNALGIYQRKYLLPALWSPRTLSCKTPI